MSALDLRDSGVDACEEPVLMDLTLDLGMFRSVVGCMVGFGRAKMRRGCVSSLSVLNQTRFESDVVGSDKDVWNRE